LGEDRSNSRSERLAIGANRPRYAIRPFKYGHMWAGALVATRIGTIVLP
jgi:hypothetical protein